MTETPEQTIARLQRELDDAKIAKLQREINDVKSTDGTGSSYSTWLPDSVSMNKPQEPVDTRLAPAPRDVPLTFRLVVVPWSWWTIFALFMVAVAPIALWISVPTAGAIVVALTFLVIAVLRVRRYRLQMGLLKWGAVANAVNPNVTAQGTYFSGTTYQNVRLAQAHGWQVERRWYSGPSTTTKIEYQLNGARGELTMRGLPYAGGVILADTRNPKRALCVSSFPYNLDRDPDGNWIGTLRARVVIGSVAMTTVLLVWTVGLTALFLGA